MKDKDLIVAMFVVLIAGLIMALWIWCDHQRWLNEPRVIKPLFPIVSKTDLRRAHQYHGINYARQDDAGRWFFMRDGKKMQIVCLSRKEVRNEVTMS